MHNHTPEVHEHADAWHHHDPEEGFPQGEHTAVIDAGLLAKWFVGIVVSVTLFIVVIAVYFTGYISTFRKTQVETSLNFDAQSAKNAAAVSLSTDEKQPEFYAWTDAQAGQVQIPISKAMQKVAAKYANRTK